MKMKERFHAICRFLTMVSQGQSPRAVLAARKCFCRCHAAVSLAVFLGANFEFTACKVVPRLSVYCCHLSAGTSMGWDCLKKICRQYLDGQKELCLARTEQKITAKALELEFEKFEKTETMDAIRRTNVSSMGSGNVGDQLIVIHTLITSLLSVLYARCSSCSVCFFCPGSSRNNFFTSPFSMLRAAPALWCAAGSFLPHQPQEYAEKRLS